MGTVNAVWRDYDQAGLDRQYNSRATVADPDVYLREYTRRTRRARMALPCALNLPYGPHKDDRLDIYRPTTHGALAPVMVFLHGGDWRALSKEDAGFAAPAFVASGAMFVALDFSAVPASTLPAMGAQVARALAWLHANVASYGGNPARLHLSGHSSGANLAGQALMTDWPLEHGLPADLIRSALLIGGLGDLEPVRLSFRNRQLALTPATVAAVSLLRHRVVARCPLLVAVGEMETADYRWQSRAVAEHWRGCGQVASLLELPGRNHFDAPLEWADPASALFAASRAQLGSA